MLYSPDAFERLAEEIERQGGAHVDEQHKPRRLAIPKGPDTDDTQDDAMSAGCGYTARFLVPYALPKGKLGRRMEERGAGIVEACAVDDDMGKWPRFNTAEKEE